MISYAQNFEDLYLHRAFKDHSSGFYIDVGAWDPVRDSVTKHFYDAGWHGINIEPEPRAFGLFPILRPRDINLNVALGNAVGRAKFYRVADTGLSTIRPDLAEEHRRSGRAVEEIEVPMTTLSEV